MKILYRYLAREVIFTTAVIALILLFIFLCNKFIRYLSYVAQGKIAASSLIHLLLLQVPILFTLLAPLGVFLGILISYGRLYNDSEMVAIFANGFSKRRLLFFTILLAVVVAILSAFLSLFVNPMIAKQRRAIATQLASSSVTQKILPGQFQSTSGGKEVYYIENLSKDHKKMQNVFFAQQVQGQDGKENQEDQQSPSKDNGPVWEVVFAQSADHQQRDGTEFFVSKNGYRYQGQPGERKYQVMKFKTYGLHVQTPKLRLASVQGVTETATTELIKKLPGNRRVAAELQWRLSIPLAVILLSLLAVPLSQVNPRQGRFFQLLPAILLAVIYVNMLFVATNWVKNGVVPVMVGVWWVHFLLFLISLLLIFRWLGWRLLKR